MQAMVIMLTETVADVSGQTDTSLGRFQTIEKDLEVASGLSDLRAIRAHLESCLVALRQANAEHRSSAAATVQRLQNQVDKVENRTAISLKHVPFSQAEIDLIKELRHSSGKSVFNTYVAGLKLKRAEHVVERFGEGAALQMLSMLGALLKAILGPNDRLLRREGASFVMFINSTASVAEIRTQLARTVANIGIQPVEVGKKSSLLAIGVDWIVLPQVASVEGVLALVDKFLANDGAEKSAAASRPA
jgi:GGDEF domain-containing protein